VKYTFEDMHDLMRFLHQVSDTQLVKFLYFNNTFQWMLIDGVFNKGFDTTKRTSKAVRSLEMLFPEVLRALKMPDEDLFVEINTIHDDTAGLVRQWRLSKAH